MATGDVFGKKSGGRKLEPSEFVKGKDVWEEAASGLLYPRICTGAPGECLHRDEYLKRKREEARKRQLLYQSRPRISRSHTRSNHGGCGLVGQ